MRRRIRLSCILIGAFAIASGTAWAQSGRPGSASPSPPSSGASRASQAPQSPQRDSQYVIGAGAVRQLDVWQVPNLGRTLTVQPNGIVVLPLAGEMHAAGLTVQQLEDQVVRRLSDFNRNVTQVSVSVSEFKSHSIYVLGRVVTPGKYAFPDAINLFDLIREAGGFADDALRTRVKVVRREDGQERTEYANVEQALNSGSLDKLPRVRSGDTVIVPKRSCSVDAGSDGVQVIGVVRS